MLDVELMDRIVAKLALTSSSDAAGSKSSPPPCLCFTRPADAQHLSDAGGKAEEHKYNQPPGRRAEQACRTPTRARRRPRTPATKSAPSRSAIAMPGRSDDTGARTACSRSARLSSEPPIKIAQPLESSVSSAVGFGFAVPAPSFASLHRSRGKPRNPASPSKAARTIVVGSRECQEVGQCPLYHLIMLLLFL